MKTLFTLKKSESDEICDEQNLSKRKSTTVIYLDSEHQLPKKQQTDINSFFGGSKPKVAAEVTTKKHDVKRLKSHTAELWKTTSLALYDAKNWLIINC